MTYFLVIISQLLVITAANSQFLVQNYRNSIVSRKFMVEMSKVIREVNPWLSAAQAEAYSKDIYQYATTNYLDPKIVAAIIAKESAFRRDAQGRAGEIGLMQLHPKYHGGGYPESLKPPTHNIATGVKYLAGLKAVYGNMYPNFRWVEFYNRGPHCRPPKKFPYANAVLKFYVRFGGELDAGYQDTTLQLSQRES